MTKRPAFEMSVETFLQNASAEKMKNRFHLGTTPVRMEIVTLPEEEKDDIKC